MTIKVQKMILPSSQEVYWTVIGEDHLPIAPIREYLAYCRNSMSPNTVKTYAYHLKLYWEYLESMKLDWETISVHDIADFLTWLRRGGEMQVIPLGAQEAKRQKSTVNATLSAVKCFYDYQYNEGKDVKINFLKNTGHKGRFTKFLEHVSKKKTSDRKILAYRLPKKRKPTLTPEQIKLIIDHCHTLRDKLLFAILADTGMRIGQLLGLRHEDIQTFDNAIKIIPRENNKNGARAKSIEEKTVTITNATAHLYRKYLEYEFGDYPSDYVFINLWHHPKGEPMTYEGVRTLTKRIIRDTGIRFHVHMFRHTVATGMRKLGIGNDLVAAALGHRSPETTDSIYNHPEPEDIRRAMKSYQERGK